MEERERLSLELENAHREIYRLKNELQWAQTVAIDYRRQVEEYRRREENTRFAKKFVNTAVKDSEPLVKPDSKPVSFDNISMAQRMYGKKEQEPDLEEGEDPVISADEFRRTGKRLAINSGEYERIYEERKKAQISPDEYQLVLEERIRRTGSIKIQ